MGDRVMRKFVFVFLVSSLFGALASVQKGNISTVKASYSIYQGDLIITGNNVTTIEGRFDINGSIIVEENATLILENAIINFTQTEQYEHNLILRKPVNGNPRLKSRNTTITSDYWFLVSLYDNSSAILYDSTNIPYLYIHDSSNASVSNSVIRFTLGVSQSSVVSVSNSAINTLLAYGFSTVSVFNSTINLLILNSAGVNCSFVNIGSAQAFYSFWDHYLNSSVVISSGGWAPNVTVRNTRIDRWQLGFQKNSNVTITDSTLFRLYPSYSTVWLINSTGGLIGFTGWGRVYILWYLNVHVIDLIGQNIPSATVTATYPNATLAELKLTDAKGYARLTLIEMMINATGEYPIGNYTVEATHLTYSNTTTVNMTYNKMVTIILSGFIIPEFPSFFILPLFMAITLLASVVHRRKHKNVEM